MMCNVLSLEETGVGVCAYKGTHMRFFPPVMGLEPMSLSKKGKNTTTELDSWSFAFILRQNL